MAESDTAKRERLLSAVRDLVLEHGIQGTSMSKISKTSGLPMGTIYGMYPAKEDLINAAYLYCKGNYLGAIAFPSIQDAAESEAAVKAAVLAYIDSAISHSRDFMFVEQCYLDPMIGPEHISSQETVLGGVGISAIIHQSSQKERSAFLVQHLVLSVIHKAISLHLSGRIQLDAETRDTVAQICWDIL